MYSPAELSIRRPVAVSMAFLSLVAVGLLCARLLPLEYFPKLDMPFIFVQVPYPGATPEEVEREITRPLEEVLATLSDVKHIESTSSADQATVQVEFDWGQDVAIKAVEARERIEAVRGQLPDDIRRINVLKFNTADQPVLVLRISSKRDLSDAYDMIMRTLIRPLERVPGVARVELQGLEPKQVLIELDADRVSAHGIELDRLQARLQQVNFSASAGLVGEGATRYRVAPESTFRDVDAYRNLVIGPDGLRLGDIAEVSYESAERDYARHLDRRYAIGLNIYKESGANLVEVGRQAAAEIERIGALPEMRGIELFYMQNQAEGVISSLTDLRNAGLLGAVLALAVLYFFLRNVPMTLTVALAVPVSITITLGIMYFIGISLNVLSMMGLMLAVGMLVDNAVVVSESIATEREKSPGDVIGASVRGVRAVALAVAAGTLTSASVFLPNIFGEQNQISIFLSHVAIAIVVSLAISLLLAQTLIPMISSRIKPRAGRVDSPLLDRLRDRYVAVLSWTLNHRWVSAGLIVATLASVAIPASLVDSEMFPTVNDRDLFLQYHLDARYPLERIKPAVDRIEEYLYENREAFQIRAVYSYYDENGTAQSTILLTEDQPGKIPSTEIAQRILADLPEIMIGKPAFESERSGGEAVSVSLVGNSSVQLRKSAEEVIRLLEMTDGISGARIPATPNETELQVRIDRDRARMLGLDSQQVAQTVAIAMRGVDLREFRSETGEVPVRLRFRDADAQSPESLGRLTLTNDAGQRIPLRALVDITEVAGADTIRRSNRETSLQIRANLSGITIEEARERINARLEPLELPPGYSWRLGRAFEREDDTGQKMVLNILLALVIIYIVLSALFESLLYPATMIASILFSVVGVYWFFLVTGTTFSLMAMIGILILIGVVVNNGIVLIDHINQLRAGGMDRDAAILQAGRDRLRPILMTVGTTVLGLVPLCVGTTQIGGDGPPYFPMARAIVGGLLFSTVVSLLFLPSLYRALDVARHWPARVWRAAMSLLRRLAPAASG